MSDIISSWGGSRPKIHLKDDERVWVRRKWEKIRVAQMKADKANLEWTSLNDSLNSYLDSSGTTDIVQRAKIKGENLSLADALAVGRWHSQDAQRHIDDLMLFLKMKELGLL